MAGKDQLEFLLTSIPTLLRLAKKKEGAFEIPIEKAKKILNLRSRKDVIRLVHQLCMITIDTQGDPEQFFHIYVDEDNPQKSPHIVFVHNWLLTHFNQFNLPITQEEWLALYQIVHHHPSLLKSIIEKIPHTHLYIKQKDHSETIRIIQKAIQKKYQVHFLYKKPQNTSVSFKKVIPIQLHEYNHNIYFFAYDLQTKESPFYKIYRMDRIISIENIIPNRRNIPAISHSEIQSWERIIQSIETNPIEEIQFAFHPSIEMNIKNTIYFQTLEGRYTIGKEKWKIGKIYSRFPDSVMDALIPYAGWIVIIKPKMYNQKIKKYLNQIINKINLL